MKYKRNKRLGPGILPNAFKKRNRKYHLTHGRCFAGPGPAERVALAATAQ